MSGEQRLNPTDFVTEENRRVEITPNTEELLAAMGEKQIKEEDGFEFGPGDTQKAA